MIAVRVVQTLEVVVGDSLSEIESGGGRVIRASNHPLVIPCDSLASGSGLAVDVDSVGSVVAPAGSTVASEVE